MTKTLFTRNAGRVALVMVASTILGGCAMLGSARQERSFEVESNWVRSTTKKDFLGFRRMNRFQPIVTANRVIQGNSIDGLVAYDRRSGNEVWRLDLVNGVEGGAQLDSEGRLFFGSSNGQFYAVDSNDGKILWTFPVRAETLAPPTIEGGVVYFQSGADVAYALEAQSGRQLWIYNRQVTGNLSIRATTRPTVSGETLLVGFSDGFLVALRRKDGGLLWERKLGRAPRFRDVDSTPVVDGKDAFVASFDGFLYSLDVEAGSVNWSLENAGGFVPVTVGTGPLSNRLYFATGDGRILFLDKKSGKQVGQIQVARGISTQPTLFKTYLVYGESEGALVVADAESGRTISRFVPGHGLMSRPTVVEGTGEAFFISNAANLYALKLGFRRAGDLLPWQVTK